MPIDAATIWEIRTTGNDLNGGGFSLAGNTWSTTLACVSGNTTTPRVGSAIYTFTSNDVGKYLHVPAGTNWVVGTYLIGGIMNGSGLLTNTTGCSTVGTNTGGSFTIDRSQQGLPEVTVDNATITATTAGANSNVISFAGYTPVATDIGNIFNAAAGTNINSGFYQITATGVGTWTVAGARNLTTAAGAASNIVGRMGGCLAHPYIAALTGIVTSNKIWVKGGTYLVDNTIQDIRSAPAVAGPFNHWAGYSEVRGDFGRPILRASGLATGNYILRQPNAYTYVENFEFDGNNVAGVRGYTCNQGHMNNCYIHDFPGLGAEGSSTLNIINTKITRCGTNAASLNVYSVSTRGILQNCIIESCSAGNSYAPIYCAGAKNCIIANNTGTTSNNYGVMFSLGATYNAFLDNLFYNNRGGSTAANSFGLKLNENFVRVRNNIFHSNSGTALGSHNATIPFFDWLDGNAYYGNTSNKQSTLTSTAGIYAMSPNIASQDVILSVDPLVNAAAGDFRLNTHPSGGNLLRGRGYSRTPYELTTPYNIDFGPCQAKNFVTPFLNMNGGING